MVPPGAVHRRFRRPRVRGALALVIAAIVVARLACDLPPETGKPLAEGVHHVERVVDGDTLLIAGEVRVRLIGVDTPETVKPDTPPEPWGAEATRFTRDFVARGDVRFTFDRERFDPHGRQLAYVWVGVRMLNEELVRAGLARAEMQFSYASAMKSRFRRAEQAARAARLGIWSAQEPP